MQYFVSRSYSKVVTVEELLMEITVRAWSKEYCSGITSKNYTPLNNYCWAFTVGELLLASKVCVEELLFLN